LVARSAIESLTNFRDQRATQGVTFVGAIECQDRSRGFDFVLDQIAHDGISCRFMSSRFVGASISICKSVKASVLPCVSMRKDRLAPPARMSCIKKFSPQTLAVSKRSTRLGCMGAK